MLLIKFTPDDLARTRIVPGLGAAGETVFALHLFGRANSMSFRPWRDAVRADHPTLAGRCDVLLRRRSSLPRLLELYSPLLAGIEPFPANTDASDGQPQQLLAEFHRAAVLPHWARVRSYLTEVSRIWGRTMVTSGVERLLGSLHPRLYWQSPVIRLRSSTNGELDLGGRGMALVPSFFLDDRECVLLPANRKTGGRPAIAFPVTATLKAEVDEAPHDQEIGHLIGHTRAAALQALADPCTTSELARRLQISLAGASQHAAVLRRAGLVTTSRRHNTATHSLSPLGRALLLGSAVPRGPMVPVQEVPQVS